MEFSSDYRVGCGTTILSHIYGNSIYMVSDGRRSSEDALLVTKGNDKKIYEINDKMCVTTAGNVALNEELVGITSREAQISGDMEKIGTRLKKYREKYLSDKIKEMGRNKKKNKQSVPPKFFRTQFGVNSVDGRNIRPYVKLIGAEEDDDFDSCNDGFTVGSGSGCVAAKSHFDGLLKLREPRTPLDRLAYMKRSVVIACLNDPYTGGFIQGAILSPNGLNIEVEKRHVIRHLADDHQHFVHILNTAILCITGNFAYNLENEVIVARLIKKRFSSVSKQLLLGVHMQTIVRSLVFSDAAATDKAFNSIGGEHILPVKLNSGGVHEVNFRRPSRDEFMLLAGEFTSEQDF